MNVDWHAFAPEVIVTVTALVVLLADLVLANRSKWTLAGIAAFGLLLAMIPVITLAVEFADGGEARVFFGGGYVVDELALVMKGLFLACGYVTLFLGFNLIEEGSYYRAEFWFLLTTAVLGMLIISSSRDLIGLFIAFELFSIPGYLMAAWKKYDLKSNEAGMKYFLVGVMSTAVLLYGMSLLYGATGSVSYEGIRLGLPGALDGDLSALAILGMVLVIISFSFKVAAVPFHFWAPDTYEGAPTPVAAFLAVAVKAAGFMGLISLIYFALPAGEDTWRPLLWLISALTMTVGNLVALRQTNMVRLLAYSSIAQSGYILAPFAVANFEDSSAVALSAIVLYLLVYSVMNFGAFAVVITVARRTGSAEMDSYKGLFMHAPALAVMMTMFLGALTGIPPLAGWLGKFAVFASLVSADTVWGYSLAVIAVINAVIAAFYYMRVVRVMFFEDVPEKYASLEPIEPPPTLKVALGGLAVLVVVLGITPLLTRLADAAANSIPLAI